METRSFIAQQTDNGFEGVYCHWDGYLSHNGRILRDHYSNPSKLAMLLAGGSMSILGEEIGSKHDFRERPERETTFYHRDRGDDWQDCRPRQFRSLTKLRIYAEGCGSEYLYLFDCRRFLLAPINDWQYAERGSQYFGMSDGTQFSDFKPLPAHIEQS